MENLYFKPLEFINNLGYMGIGMLGVFIIVGIIAAATYAIGGLTKKNNNDR